MALHRPESQLTRYLLTGTRMNQLAAESPASPVRAGPLAFSDELIQSFHNAAASCGSIVERYISLAGNTLCLRFAGPALYTPFYSSLAHLEIHPASEPDLTILLWDSASTQTAPPSLPWTRDDHSASGEIRGFCDERFLTLFQLQPQVLTMVDAERSLALVCCPDAKRIPVNLWGAPLRNLLNAWLGQRGLSLLHSAAVGYPHGGVLLLGQGGAGKSNTALACLSSDLLYLGDDYCLFGNAPAPTLYSIYNSAKVHPRDLVRLPALQDLTPYYLDSTTSKHLYFLQQSLPTKLITEMPILAILIPVITGERGTTILPTSAGAAMRIIAPGTVLGNPRSSRAVLANLGQLVRSVPGFELRLGTAPEQIPQVISDLLTGKRA